MVVLRMLCRMECKFPKRNSTTQNNSNNHLQRVGENNFDWDWKIKRDQVRLAEEQRAEEARREEETRREEARREAVESLLGKTGRVCGAMFEQWDITQKEITEKFKLGSFPMGFSDQLLWKEIVKAVKNLPGRFKEKEERITQLTNEEKKISNALKELKAQKKNLQQELQKTQESKIALENECSNWFAFKENFTQVAKFVDNCAAVEEQLAATIEKQIALDVSAFTADTKGDVPLSLVFNAYGMDASAIQRLHSVDGEDFLDHEFIMTCRDLDVPLGEQYDLVFLQKALSNGEFVLLQKRHLENCPVCSSNTLEMFCDLVVEHKVDLCESIGNPEFDITLFLDYVKRFNIGGRQFLGVSIRDLRTSFPQERFVEMKKILHYFKSIHLKA